MCMEIGAVDEDPFVLGAHGCWGGSDGGGPEGDGGGPGGDGGGPGGDGGDGRKFKRRRRKKFHNQLPLVTRAGKAVKLFHNGSIHVTGCASPIEFLDLVTNLCDFLASVCAIPRPRLETFDTQMINANFLLCTPGGDHVKLRPKRLRAELSSAGDQADFETERHPGVKLAVTARGPEGTLVKVATVMVFQTGSIQISGAKHPAHIATAYEDACARLDAIVGEVGDAVLLSAARETRTTTAKQVFTITHGYPATLYNPCLM